MQMLNFGRCILCWYMLKNSFFKSKLLQLLMAIRLLRCYFSAVIETSSYLPEKGETNSVGGRGLKVLKILFLWFWWPGCVDAISKLEEASKLDPKQHYTVWCLGMAHTKMAFTTPDRDEAMVCINKASRCYHQALDEVNFSNLLLQTFTLGLH